MHDFLCKVFASAFGLGLAPIAPGTFGALLGVVIHLIIIKSVPPSSYSFYLGVSLFVVCIVHWLLTSWAIEYWDEKDPRHFVLDEVAGYLFTMHLYFVWVSNFKPESVVLIMIVGFFLVRVIDILKVWPANLVDRNMGGAVGILLDDLISAIYAAAVLILLTKGGYM